MKLSALAIVVACMLPGSGALASEPQVMSLASVAHRLGFVYAYLGPDDEVSLTGHGLAVLVRPGDPYFTVNDRREPVEGDAPLYMSGDLFISPAFARQLTTIERSAASNERDQSAKMVSSKSLHIGNSAVDKGPHHVLAVNVAAVPGTGDVAVTGQATPGAFIAIVLIADMAPELPTIYLNRSFATALGDGSFAIVVPTAPNYFSGSTLIAEASSIDDLKPLTARFTPVSR